MTSNGRAARLTALALATGTLVAAGAGGAAAATSTSKLTNQIQALGNGAVVHLHIALPASVPGVGQIIDQYISTTDGTVTTVTNLGAKSVGTIGKGQVPIISDLLAGQAVSDLAGKHSDSVALVDQDNLAGLGLTLKALVAKSNVKAPNLNGVVSHSESTVASVKLGTLTLPALSKTTDTVQSTLGTVLGTVDTTTNTATDTIAGVVKTATATLDAATNNASAPVSDTVKTAVATVKTQLDTLIATIQSAINGLTAGTGLIDLGVMKSSQTITRQGMAVTSSVENSLAGLSLLGGLVSVDALASQASATAGGKPGTASVLHTPGVLTVHVADALTLKIGKTIELTGSLGSALPPALQDTVNSTLTTVLGLLRDTLGLDFQPGTAVESVAKDGTSAATTVSAAKLILNPPVIASLLPKGEKLLTVELVGAQAAVGDRLIAQGAAPSTPVTIQSLPRTGANLPLTATIATGLMGLAFVARRRRLSHSE
ncbi:MAG: hypothetical protein QOJ09_1899 [Actinomycetota bacterium]|nr:hypothetical protein [Actinomycetota bacterium]